MRIKPTISEVNNDSLTIVPPKPLSSELNTEGVIDFRFHSGGANKREAFIYREFSYIVATISVVT
jgi:hypothetical protein